MSDDIAHVSIAKLRAIARAPDPLEAIRAATADGAAIGDVVRALAREAWWCREPLAIIRGDGPLEHASDGIHATNVRNFADDRGLYRGHP